MAPHRSHACCQCGDTQRVGKVQRSGLGWNVIGGHLEWAAHVLATTRTELMHAADLHGFLYERVGEELQTLHDHHEEGRSLYAAMAALIPQMPPVLHPPPPP